ncbi:MAG TPA: hypothetical protein VJ861_02900 [Treponemataceae bacterium]|nr:hypothetical protein [Treponemataceae bacterium]
MILSIPSITVLVIVGTILLVFAYSLFTLPSSRKKPVGTPRATGNPGESGVCPVCKTILKNKEQLKTALFPGETDRLCHIFGCPTCHPYPEDPSIRKCPVCKKIVPEGSYLIARLFERPGNKRHVHILGCSECRFKKR